MNDLTSTFHSLAPGELLDRLVEFEDRAPLELIDAAAAHGDAMVAALQDVIDGERSWESDIIGEWWLLLHAAFILGRIPSEAAGILLVRLMRTMDEQDDADLQDWLAGNWPALFANKPDGTILAAGDLAHDDSRDWYIRCQALDVMLDAGMREDAAALDAAIDRVAALAADETRDGMLREMAATSLLDFPRQRHRALLESLAEGTARSGEEYGFDAVGAFAIEDINDAFRKSCDDPEWLRRGDPWQFYSPEAITARQRRWQEEGASDEPFDFDDAFALPYVRQAPKVGRNDPCPCGSGRKYKRCCLARDEATVRQQLSFTL